MGISVTALRNKLVGGGARPSLFYVHIIPPALIDGGVKRNAGIDNAIADEIPFFIKGASMPSSSISSVPINFLGREFKVPSMDRTFEDWNVTVINDTNYKIRHLFEIWIELMSPSSAIFESASGFGENPTVYGSMSVHQMNPNGGVAYNGTAESGKYLASYYFKDVFPTNVSSIDLNWDSKDQIEEFNVTFAYQYFEKIPDTAPDNVTNVNSKSPFEGDTTSWASAT